MKITKIDLKNIIKECITEVLNEQPKPYDFDADWKRMDEQGIPVTHISEEQYKSLIGETKQFNSVEEILKG
jgi:hypothetical protein